MARIVDKNKPEQNPRNIGPLKERIQALREQQEAKYQELYATKDNATWFKILGEINSLSVDIDNCRKQYAFRNYRADYVVDQYVINK